MVDLVDRAQELEELQREEALQRVLNRARPMPAGQQSTPSPKPSETDET